MWELFDSAVVIAWGVGAYFAFALLLASRLGGIVSRADRAEEPPEEDRQTALNRNRAVRTEGLPGPGRRGFGR